MRLAVQIAMISHRSRLPWCVDPFCRRHSCFPCASKVMERSFTVSGGSQSWGHGVANRDTFASVLGRCG